MKVVVITSGYFDPIHIGHIEYLEKSKLLGDYLITIVNNDEQLLLKRGNDGTVVFKDKDRCKIVQSLRAVDKVFLSIDVDRTVSKSIEAIKKMFNDDKVIFAKGGDRTKDEIPESEICKELDIQIVDGLGNKIQNSSDIIRNIKNEKK